MTIGNQASFTCELTVHFNIKNHVSWENLYPVLILLFFICSGITPPSFSNVMITFFISFLIDFYQKSFRIYDQYPGSNILFSVPQYQIYGFYDSIPSWIRPNPYQPHKHRTVPYLKLFYPRSAMRP